MLTLGNLVCGASAAIALLAHGDFVLAFWLVVASAIFDFFDGFASRLLKSTSAIGVQLDSLADMVSFGLVPAVAMFCWYNNADQATQLPENVIAIGAYLTLIIVAFSALRLAKFNIDERQTTSFIGLATPPNAIFWASFVCWINTMVIPTWAPWVLLAGSLLSCYLLVSEIPFFSFKSAGNGKKHIIIFLVGCTFILGTCATMSVTYKQITIAILSGAICILWYILCNFCTHCHK
jgi:CDP-diacylglycerol--serine O-phosphatidyltransferase